MSYLKTFLIHVYDFQLCASSNIKPSQYIAYKAVLLKVREAKSKIEQKFLYCMRISCLVMLFAFKMLTLALSGYIRDLN